MIGIGGDPVPRHSAGEPGSIYAFNHNAGGNVGECFAFGRIAGCNASKVSPLKDRGMMVESAFARPETAHSPRQLNRGRRQQYASINTPAG